MTTQLLAHGLGGSTDLPIPFTYALIGAAWTLTFTFAVVALAWRTPKFDADKPGRALPAWVTRAVDASATRWILAAIALALTAWVAYVAHTGPQNGENALPGVFYVLLWVGLVALSLAIGPVWRVLSPVRSAHKFLGRRTLGGTYPEALGYWPAAAGLFAFVWLELASPDPGALGAIRTWLIVYLVITFAGTLWCGPRWSARADPFEVYSVVASRFSVVRRNADGRIAIGNPFDHLLTLPVRPGVVAVLSVLLGSTAFDSFSAMPQIRTFVGEVTDSAWGATAVRTAGLALFVGVVAVTFCAAARCTGGVDRRTRRELPGLLAHSLIPIVLGYVFAHYLTYLVERGQQTVHRLFGLDADVVYLLSMHPGLLATLKVGFVLLGHVAGVIAAHDRALRLLPKENQLTGQLAMMLVMVGYTFTGLYLLFGRVRCARVGARVLCVVSDDSLTQALAGGAPQRVGWFRYFFADERWEWSEQVQSLHGYEPGTVTPTTELVLSHKHPDDRQQVAATLDEMRRTHRTFSTRHRIIDTRGETHEVVVIGDQLLDDTGRLIGTHGFYVDMTPTDAQTKAMMSAALAEITENRAAIEQVKGMLMLIYRVDEQTAFELLRWRSQETNVKLRRLADQLLADYGALVYDEELPPRATFDHLLLTAHQRMDRGEAASQ